MSSLFGIILILFLNNKLKIEYGRLPGQERSDKSSDVTGNRQQTSGKHIFCIFILGRLTCGKESGPSLLPLQISPGEASGRKQLSLRMRDEIGDM